MQRGSGFTAAERAPVYLSAPVGLIHVYVLLWELLAPQAGW